MAELHYLLRPLDTALFRDGRSFEAGEARGARSAGAVPAQRAVYGILRTALLEYHGIPYPGRSDSAFGVPAGSPLAAALGTPASLGGFRLTGPFLANESGADVRLFLPRPADLVSRLKPDGNLAGYSYLAPPPEPGPALSNAPGGLPACVPGPARVSGSETLSFETEDSWLPAEARSSPAQPAAVLRQYLTQREPRLTPGRELFDTEPHTGLERDWFTSTAKDGRLYTVEFLRLAQTTGNGEPSHTVWYTAVHTDHPEVFPQRLVLAAGGERRPFELRRAMKPPVDWEPLWPEVRESVLRSPDQGRLRFRLCLLTPGRFAAGWRPPLDHGLVLKGATVPRPAPVSGWDLARGGPRPSSLQVPAGAVFFVELECDATVRAAKLDELKQRYWLQPIAGDDPEAKALGAGICLIGAWNS